MNNNSIDFDNIEDIFPLSDIQMGMIYESLITGTPSFYYNQSIIPFTDKNFDFDRFKRAVSLLVDKHPMLRTGFNLTDPEELVQVVYKKVPLDIEYYDLCQKKPADQESYIKSCLLREKEKFFDISGSEPFWRIRIFQIDRENIYFTWINHHAIHDGWSLASFMTDLNNTYLTLQNDPHFVPAKLKSSYKNFIIDQLIEKKNVKTTEFWKNELKDYKRFEIPGKIPEYIEKNKKRWISKDLGIQTLEKLMGIAQKYNISPRHICFAAYAYTLYMVSYGNDFLVGMVIHNRPECEDGDKIIGCFLNEMPVRIKIPAQLKWIEYIYLIDRKLVELTDFNKLSLFEIARIIGEKKPGRNPFFDTIFNYTDFHIYNRMDRSLLEEMETHSHININSLSDNTQFETNTPLDFRVDISGTLLLNVSFFDSVLTQEMGEKLCLYFANVINCFINETAGIAKKEAIMGIEEKVKLLYEFNNTAVNFPREKSIAQLFAEQVEKSPDRVALVGDEGQAKMEKGHLSYQELNERAGKLAGLLLEKGVLPDTIVAIIIERSVEMIIGIIGILKSGGAYLPIDPNYPQERIQYMLRDSKAKIIVNSEFLMDAPQALFLHHSAFVTQRIQHSNHLAYVIYTSGSTGKPKGVAIQHRSVINFIKGITDIIPITSNDRMLSLTTISFDIFGLETLVPFICGSVVIMGSREEQLNPEAAAIVLERELISIFQVTPSKLQMLISFPGTAIVLKILKYLLVGGEIFPDSLLTKVKTLISGKIFNMYGPTETTIWSTVKEVNIETLEGLNIGKPIANTSIYILDHSYMLVPIGVTGELFIGGNGLARGYLNRPELTAEKFDQNLWDYKDDQDENGALRANFQHSKYYRTGDLARWLPDGNIEFQGRIDQQVKIRGFRIELGEIESCLLKYPGIKEAVLMTPEKESGEKYLCAYIVAIHDLMIAELREYLANELPDYMIPSHFMQIEKIPLTSNGKVDRHALDLYSKQLDTGNTYAAPENDTQEKIIEIWKKVLKINKIGINDNYFDLGGTSFDIIRINKNLRDTFQVEIPIPVMFRFTTVHSLENFLNNKIRKISDQTEDLQIERSSNFKKEEKRTTEIAVIGMSGKFPGAKDLAEFWHNIKNGKETISFFSAKELKENNIPDNLLNNANYVKAAGILEDIEYFDASFFGYTPKEAEIMDPQFRIFHECVWNALEDAGYNSIEYKGLIGLYAGASSNTEWQVRIFMSGKNRDIGHWAANHLFDKSFLTLTISYKLNLRGPSLELNTACSTSLAAIHTGCTAILNGECDMALAGGVSISHLEKGGYLYEEGMIFSPDGHCRVFDTGARGTISSNGAGVVVLKRLDDAVLDKDHIYAVIKGTAINNDGTNKAGFTAPSVEGQALVIRMALEMAGVPPGSINYIETHGTGTKLGDPVEIEALKLAFKTDKKSFCAVGSIKSNIGHTDNAAGVAGFLKTILAITHKCIPPTLNFEIPNLNIDFINSPFYINSVLSEWERGEYPRRAGVSAFGIGGTNAHVILEEWTIEKEKKRKNLDYKLFLLSARTESALNIIRKNLADYLKNNPDVNLEDMVYTLQLGRRFYNYRWMAICSTNEEAVAALTSNNAGEAHTITWEEEKHNAIKIEFNDGKERLVEIGRLWLHGHKIDFKAFYPGSNQFRVPLPTYPFEKQKYWLNPVNLDYILQNGKSGDYVPDKTDQLETFNINNTGKEKELYPLHPRPNLANEYVMPRNSTEKAIAVIWQRLFGFDAIGVKDDFLELGGNSLNAITVISHIYEELGVNIPVTEFFRRTTIEQMADYIQDNKKKTNYTNIEPVEKKEYYLLSSAQLRIYILHQMNTESKSYNIPFCFTIKGILDISQLEYSYILQQIDLNCTAYNMPEIIPLAEKIVIQRLEESFKKLVKRHDSLRTSFHMIGDQPAQKVHDEVEFKIEIFGRGDPAWSPEIITNFIRPFDLSHAPLLRVGLVRAESEKYFLLVDMHHIISDGVSHELLVKDFLALQEGKELPALRLQYKDFVQWQNSQKEVHRIRRQMEYWLKEFAGEIPLLEIPMDYPRPMSQSFEGNSIDFEISAEETRTLKNLALQGGATLFMVLAAAVNILLSKLSGQEEIIVGTPIAGRRHADLEKIIGMFVNTLALRNFPVGDQTVKEFLADIKRRVLMAFENQEYPFEELVDKLALKRDIGRNPLFDVMFVLQNIDSISTHMDEETPLSTLFPLQPDLPKEYDNITQTAKFDLTIYAVETRRNTIFNIQYCTKLFKKETVQRFSYYFKKIVAQIIENPGLKLKEIEITLDEERHQLLFEFNNTENVYTNNKTIHGLFEEQVEQTPHSIVLVGADRGEEEKRRREEEKRDGMHLSYYELNEHCDRLAGLLIDKGVQTDNIIGIMAERSFEMIIGLLGILKSGAAYLPLNPRQPETRTLFMMKDSRAKLLVVANGLEGEKARRWEGEKNFQIVCLDSFHSPCQTSYLPNFLTTHPFSLAYLIYTSGSTGNPKGAAISHANLSPLMHWGYQAMAISEKDRFLQNLSYFFDWSAWEMFLALTTGARLNLANEDILLDGCELGKYIAKHEITVLHITPSQFQVLVGVEIDGRPLKFERLKHLCLGAEKLTYDLVKRSIQMLRDDCRIYNMYGPTEATIISSVLEINRNTLDNYQKHSSIPIGVPVGNTRLYVLNKYFNLCPRNVAGELFIGGEGLSRGYLNNPELTAEKFINFHHSSFDILRIHRSNLYRTGDLARWLADGVVEFLGRIDHQVKVRGYRIELGEIENKLLAHKRVKAAVAILRGETELCAFVVPEEPGAHEIELKKELKEYLTGRLPGYMVPSFIALINRISLTPNGKVDLQALPQPETELIKEYIAPRNGLEEKLATIWSDILGISKDIIGIDAGFFELGGHSLKATVLASRIHKELNVILPLAELFKAPTIRGLSEYIWDAQEEIYQSIMPVEEKEYYELSFAQQRMYILQQMDLNSTAYNMPEIIPLAEEVDISRLEESFKKLIKRHDSLRTSFHMIGDQPAQKVHDEVEFKIEIFGRGDPAWSPEIITNFTRPFDLSHAPLLRVGLFKSEAEKHLLMVDMHHIISDGVSHEVLVKDFLALQEGKELPALRLQYKDFAQWQNSPKEIERLNRQMFYWLEELTGEIPILELPNDFPRPKVQSFAGNSIDFEISAEETRTLKTLALQGGTTLFMVLAAAVNILLAKLSGQEEIIIGTPIAGRRHADLEKIIGMFVNTLVLRNYPRAGQTFNQFLEDIKTRVLLAFENQEYPFEALVDKLLLKRDVGRNPLFDVLFVLQNMDTQSTDGDEENRSEIHQPIQLDLSKEYENLGQAAKFDLTFTAKEKGREIFFSIQYCTQLFKKETINRFIPYLKNIINGVIENKDRRISDLEIITEEEKKRILVDFNNTGAEYPKDKTIHQLFEEQVKKSPDRIALVGAGSQTCPFCITYGHLDKQSNRLAGLLIEKGLLPDTIVGIMMERSVEMVIGIMGILKAGGAYMPIDPEYPQERIDYMLKDSNAKILINKSSFEARISKFETNPNVQIINDQNKNQNLGAAFVLNFEHLNFEFVSNFDIRISNFNSSNLAYIIYTSGTTGRPKGSLIEHRNVVRLLSNDKFQFDFSNCDVWTLFHSFCFDFSVWEMYGALLYGGKLIIVPKMTARDTSGFLGLLNRESVTVLNQTPSAFYSLIAEALSSSQQERKLYIKYIIFGGEALDPLKLKNWRKKYPLTRFINMFGITETTVHVTYKEINNEEINSNISNIGKPIPTLNVYILDKYLNPVPIGVVGEICVGGKGVCRGYLNRVELMGGKFIENPFKPGDRLYRSGDMGRLLENGDLVYLGRIDKQVKIRGYRIELGEIEHQLTKYPGIKDIVVINQEEKSEDKYLCAYFVTNEELVISELREFLTKELPDYMIPSYFVRIEKIPLTVNGKVDWKALPAPGIKRGEGYAPPGNEIEEKLAGIWSEILGIDKNLIGMNESFFQLGGHSLKATILASRIHKELNAIIPLGEVFKAPTIKNIGKYIKNAKSSNYKNIEWNLVLIKEGLSRNNHLFFIHDGSGEVEGYVEFCKHLTDYFNCWGIRADRLENLAPHNVTIQELAEKYIGFLKKIQPHGPYYIAGWSLGGAIAFEIATQLEQANEEIAFLALIDSPSPHMDLWVEGGEFNFESELNLIKEYSPASEWIEKAKNAPGVNQLWVSLVDYLEASNYDVEIIKKTIAEYGVQALPNFHQLDIKETIYYLNLGRTLRNARARYKPSHKIHIPIHYFAASESKNLQKEYWKQYTVGDMAFYEIEGDHFSIFKMPIVTEFAAKFAAILRSGLKISSIE